jgi:hypothetical protein
MYFQSLILKKIEDNMSSKEQLNLEELKKKLKLNNFDEYNSVFELSTIKEEEFVHREARRKIISRFDYVMNILNNFLHPDSTIIELNDADSLTDGDRDEALDLLRQISVIIKKHQMLEIASDDKKEQAFLIESLTAYKSIYPKVIKMIEKTMKQIISKDLGKESMNYLG